MLSAGPRFWYSGTSGRPIELGREIHDSDRLAPVFVLGWIE